MAARATFATRLERVLADDDTRRPAADEITDYLATFDGGHFERYDSSAPPNLITPGDLVAVTMLSMEIRRTTKSGFTPAIALRIEATQGRIRPLLEAIPTDRVLHTLSESDYERWIGDGPAIALWRLLRDELGVPRIAAYKLLARKRPHLLPIQDSATRAALGSPAAWWSTWWRTLSEHPKIVERIETIRANAGAGHLSVLRTADIVTWMRHSLNAGS